MDFALTINVLIGFVLCHRQTMLLPPSAALPMITDAFVAERTAG